MTKHDAPFYIILNAGSGHEDTALRRATIEEVLTRAGRRFELAMVDDADELDATAQRMVAQAQASGGIVVAAGGDGTISSVAARAAGSGCPFGVLPQGTFNYFARTHGIPEELGEAVQALLASRVQPVQIGMVNDRIFLVNASIGLYPKLLEERELDKKQFGRSRLVAVFSALKTALGAFKRLRIRLETDGRTRTLRTATLFVGNNRLQMAQLGLPPLMEALEDGELAALAPRSVGRLGMLWLFARGALGRLGEADDLVAFSFRSMTVRKTRLATGRKHMKVATDGEVTTLRTPLEFRALEGQLLLLKPLKAAEEAEAAPSWL